METLRSTGYKLPTPVRRTKSGKFNKSMKFSALASDPALLRCAAPERTQENACVQTRTVE